MGDPDDVAVLTAVEEEAVDCRSQVTADVQRAKMVIEFGDAGDAHGLAHGAALAQAKEARHAGVDQAQAAGLVDDPFDANAWRTRHDHARGLPATTELLAGLVDFLVDVGNLLDPNLPFFVLHSEHLIERPMKVVTDVRYLLVQAIQGVAYDSPRSPPVSISKL